MLIPAKKKLRRKTIISVSVMNIFVDSIAEDYLKSPESNTKDPSLEQHVESAGITDFSIFCVWRYAANK